MNTTNTPPKIRPILFSTNMVRAILNGHKTQTRRIIKVKRPLYFFVENGIPYENTESSAGAEVRCPYGNPDDILWVRETWKPIPINIKLPKEYFYKYKADHPYTENLFKWKPAIHMPKDACRLFLKIVDIRVEKLHNITDIEALSEGVLNGQNIFINNELTEAFKILWKSINGEESWESNPWVWVIEFVKCEKPFNFS